MASFKAKFPVLQELFAKNHRGGPFGPPPAGRGINQGVNLYLNANKNYNCNSKMNQCLNVVSMSMLKPII